MNPILMAGGAGLLWIPLATLLAIVRNGSVRMGPMTLVAVFVFFGVWLVLLAVTG